MRKLQRARRFLPWIVALTCSVSILALAQFKIYCDLKDGLIPHSHSDGVHSHKHSDQVAHHEHGKSVADNETTHSHEDADEDEEACCEEAQFSSFNRSSVNVPLTKGLVELQLSAILASWKPVPLHKIKSFIFEPDGRPPPIGIHIQSTILRI